MGIANHSVSMKIISESLKGAPAAYKLLRFLIWVTKVVGTRRAKPEYHSQPICDTEPSPGAQ